MVSEWLKISLLLCFFGFLKELRPSEIFYFEYFTGKWFNCTSEMVQQTLMPISNYSQLASALMMFFVTDLFCYKPFLVGLAASGIVCWSFLSWGKTLFHLKIFMIFYGIFFGTEVAYFTYIYAKVPKEHYLQVTSHTRAALIFGHGVSGILSQILIQLEILDYQQLNYITFSAMVLAIIWALMLPPVKTSVYFHNQNNANKDVSQRYINAFKLIKHHFVASYSQWYVIKWSLWWSLSTCGFIHVQVFMQPLWSLIVAEDGGKLYNGIAETVMTIAGFIAAILVGFLKVDWKKYGELALISCSALSALFIIISSQTNKVLISYAAYTAFGGVFYFVITIATSEIAKHILDDSYGLVFGLNTFLFLVLQSFLMTVFVTGDIGWALNPRDQHFAYGLCHGGVAILFALNVVVRFAKRLCFPTVLHTKPREPAELTKEEKN